MRKLRVPELFELLKDTPSRNEKIKILEAHKDNALFVKVVKTALDPMIRFNFNKIPEHTPTYGSFMSLEKALKDLEILSSKRITGNKAKDFLAKLLESLDEEEGAIIIKVVRGKLDCGVDAKTFNKAWGADTIPVFPCMLCQPYSEKTIQKIKYPAISQEKKDGLRGVVIISKGIVDIRTRNGLPLGGAGIEKLHQKFLDMVEGTIFTDAVFDGEINVMDNMGLDLPRKISNGMINRSELSDDEIERVRFSIWDVVPLSDFKKGHADIKYEKRWEWVQGLVDNTQHSLFSVPKHRIVQDEVEAKRHAMDIISQGGEGTILKNSNAPWEDKRTPHQVKFKVEETCDLEIIGIEEGEDANTGKLGSFVCKSSDGGLVVNVGGGFSAQQRIEFFTEDMIGKIIEVKANELNTSKSKDTYSLVNPRFTGHVRDDKSEANTTEFILESYNKYLAS